VDIAGYRVERLPNSGGVWAIYGSQILPGNDIVVEVNLGDAHQYRVSTVDTGGRVGSPSAAVEIRFDAIPNILPPDFPTNVSVTYL
jgi:hypothetical protein